MKSNKVKLLRTATLPMIAAAGVVLAAGAAQACPGMGQTATLPVAQSRGEIILAACKACNPCAAKTKASSPCNPCAAKNPCNPCAAKTPCNPCAAKKK